MQTGFSFAPTGDKKTDVPLNAEQQAAVDAREGFWQCAAWAGSGKTRVIVRRYQELLKIVGPEDILSLTFTREAANEMRKRAGREYKIEYSRPNGFLTLHSLALSFATKEAQNFPFKLAPFPLATGGQQVKLLSDTVRRYPTLDFRVFRSWVSRQRREGISPIVAKERASDASFLIGAARDIIDQAAAYADFDRRCREAGVMDYDALLFEMAELLEKYHVIRTRWQYQFIQVDESQDLDTIQWKIIKLLSAKHGNVFAVGDVNQSIYKFRGAEPEIFQKFHEMFPNAKTLYLGANYRSTVSIVDFCKKIAPVKNELSEQARSVSEQGVPIQILKAVNNVNESEMVLKEIQGLNILSTAILARTNRALRQFEEKLAEAGIKYYLLGESGFYGQEEIKNVLAYIQIASGKWYDAAVIRALRSPYQPTRFIKKKELSDALGDMQDGDPNEPTMRTLLESYSTSDTNQQNAINGFKTFLHGLSRFRDLPAGDAVRFTIDSLQAREYYDTEEEAGMDNDPVENLNELVRIATRFPTLTDFLAHVQKVQAASRVKKGVALATVHGAKGGEWENVFVTGVQEGLFPHKRATDVAEESRIFYVACSRPKKRLYLSYWSDPSRFIKEFLVPKETQ